jgi:N-acetyl-anhydromuramyl-L-alanine amidase AmpD
MRKIDLIVVHASDTPASMDIGAEEIRQWHLQRGWRDIGYHHVIRRDGEVEEGRSHEVTGAHVRGHNATSIGICMVGGGGGLFNYTWLQLFALRGLLVRLKEVYPDAAIVGHRDLDEGKECPCFSVVQLLKGMP